MANGLVTANQFRLTPDAAGGISRGLQLGQQIQQTQQGLQQAQFQPQINQLRQQALGGDQAALIQLAGIDPSQAQEVQKFQTGQATSEQEAQDRRVRSVVEGALRLQNLPDDASRLRAAKARRAQILSENVPGTNTVDTDEIIGLFESGRAEQANALIGSAVKTGRDLKILQAAPITKPTKQAGKEGLVFDTSTGTFTVDPVAKARLDEVANKAKTQGGLDFKDRQSLNKDVTNIIKNTVGINNTAKDLDKLGELGSGPASIALVFKFMKALDPTSVVREGEFATAQNSAGVDERISNIYNKLVTGERLGDVQIKQFVETAKILSNAATDSSNAEISSLLNTFGDTIPEDFKAGLLNRIPARFESKTPPPVAAVVTGEPQPLQGPITPGGQVESIGDFTNQSNEQLLSF